MNSPGGSTTQFAMSTGLPSRSATPYFAFRASRRTFRSAARAFFASLLRLSFAAFSRSTFEKSSEKSI